MKKTYGLLGVMVPWDRSVTITLEISQVHLVCPYGREGRVFSQGGFCQQGGPPGLIAPDLLAF
jgi:hypothetical protein